MSGEVQSFEFILGMRLYYRYDVNNEIEVLYGNVWMNLKDFIATYYGKNTTKQYEEQPNLEQQ